MNVDVDVVVQQMRLDRLAVQASCALADADVPHVLLKGPTTARWLYSPPRTYRDVDLLVPHDVVQSAVRALEAAGVARASAGRLGEEASHSLLMLSPTGIELDLHITLPMLELRSDRTHDLWDALKEHIESFDLDGVAVPALDEPARCLVLALHALGNGQRDARSLEDLRRARLRGSAVTWDSAAGLAGRLGASALLQAGVTLVEKGPLPADLPLAVRLRLTGASGGAYQLERLRQVPRRRRPALILRELFPSVGFMRYANPSGTRSAQSLTAAYFWRLVRLGRALPGEWRLWEQQRREALKGGTSRLN